MDSTELIAAGHEALARGDWDEARRCFEAAVAAEQSPEALEGLGIAAWWLDDAEATFDARERAYRLYRQRGDRQSAARMAVSLAEDSFDFRGEEAVANGWRRRAYRLLDGLGTVPERGWLALWEGNSALFVHQDTQRARELAAEAASIGRSLGLIDLEMTALALEGLALVSEGELSAGMPKLDESTAAAVGGDMSDLTAIGVTCCYLIYACEWARDYERAAQWCERVTEFSKRWSFRSLFSVCRTHYAGVLMWRGAWLEAEEQLAAAIAPSHPPILMERSARLAELRRRQGRWEEATALFAQVEGVPIAHLGRAALALDRDDAATALDLARRFLRSISPRDRTQRADGLELLVRAAVAAKDLDQAASALSELQSIASDLGTQPLSASARFAEGVLAAGRGDHETARPLFEDAIDLFERCGAPFEAARVRIELASVLSALGRPAPAQKEARLAQEALEKIGAAGEVERAAGLLRRLAEPPRAGRGSQDAVAGLTRREIDVLRLVAQGLNDREIATKLVLSGHTVHRHISNVLAKLGLPSRAAAVAHAARYGLL